MRIRDVQGARGDGGGGFTNQETTLNRLVLKQSKQVQLRERFV